MPEPLTAAWLTRPTVATRLLCKNLTDTRLRAEYCVFIGLVVQYLMEAAIASISS